VARLVRTQQLAIALVILLIHSVACAQEAETWPLSEAIEVREGACVTRNELVASIENWLGRNAIDRRIKIVVEETEPSRPHFVVMRDGKPSAERRFRGGSINCADLRAAVALAIALAIDATLLQAVLEPPAPSAPPDLAPESKPKPEPKPKPKRAPAPRHAAGRPHPPNAEPAGVWGEAAVLVLIGVLPAPAWGGAIGLGMAMGPISLRALGWATAVVEAELGSGRARVGMVAGELGACVDRPLGGLRVHGCAGAAGGGITAEGRGFDVNRAAVVPWIAATAGLGAELPLGSDVGLIARVQGYFPVARPTLEVNDPRGGVLHQEEVPPAGVGASLGVRVGFP
jgi:hypothetical protein